MPVKPLKSYSVTLSSEELGQLQELAREHGRATVAPVLRLLAYSARTMFGLPGFMADRLREDMRGQGFDFFDYVKEVLALRYERLASEDAAKRTDDARRSSQG